MTGLMRLLATALSLLARSAQAWGGAPSGAELEQSIVTCGSLVKLQHEPTKYYLHSHEIAYGSGSGQQSVTGFPGQDDANSMWLVRGEKDGECQQGTPVKAGRGVRLQHHTTRRWLHSHLFPSPLTGNQEVSAYGDDSASDTGDVWVVELQSGDTWKQDSKVRLRHRDTGAVLASSERKYPRPIQGQQEVCAKKRPDAGAWWLATEGVYFPARADS